VTKPNNVYLSEVCSIFLRLAGNTRKLFDFYVQRFFLNSKRILKKAGI